MAISMTNLLNNGLITAQDSYTTASITPSANALILLLVSSGDTASPPVIPTASGNGLTYVQVTTAVQNSGATGIRLTLFRAMGSAPTAGAITIDFAGDSQALGVRWQVTEFGGVNRSGTNGSGAVVQSGTNNGLNTTTLVVTLASFANAISNVAFGGFVLSNHLTDITPGSGFTEIAESSHTNQLIESEWRTGEDTGVDATWASSTISAALACEIQVGGSNSQAFII